jgi:dipeptidyl aminopeptidase/acylaminoacyl peptidase
MVVGAEDAWFPFWSPDNQNLGFLTDRGLMRMSAAGGPPQLLAPAYVSSTGASPSGAWSESVIVFTGRDKPCIYRIPSGGGTPTPVTTLDPSRDEVLHLHPRFLPGGKQFLYLVHSRRTEYDGVYVRSLDTDDHKLLVHTRTQAEYIAPGYLLFVNDSILFAQRFNLSRLELEGDPLPIAQPVSMNIDNGGAAVSASRDGSLVYFARADAPAALKWLDREGHVPQAVGPRGIYRGVELSPDERTVLVKTRGREVTLWGDVWTIDLARAISSRLTSGAESLNARWSPDLEYVFFDSRRAGAAGGIYRKRADGTGPEELVYKTDGELADVSREGRLLVQERSTCAVIEPTVKTRRRFIESTSVNSCGRFSEDGRFVAHTENESGRFEVYAEPFPEGTPRIQLSSDGGREPRWRKDGKELFYLALDGKLMSVTLTYAPTLQASHPKELFQAVALTSGPFVQYSVASDGRRFLMIDPFEDPRAESLTIIAHWSDTLQQR